MAKLSDSKKGQLSDQLAELYRVTSNGQRDYEQVRRAVQNVIEGKFSGLEGASSVVPVNIVERVMRQLDQYEENGFGVSSIARNLILNQAGDFEPLSVYDRPLVTGVLGRTGDPSVMNRAWAYVLIPGYRKARRFSLQQFVESVESKSAYDYPRLVHFLSASNRGLSSKAALGEPKVNGARLAGGEVMEMLLVEPEWALEWNGTTHPYPLLSALRVKLPGGALIVPALDLIDRHRDEGPHLRLTGLGEADTVRSYCSPAIREC